jgi:glutathione S-transferase
MVQFLLDRYGDGRLQPQTGTAEHALYLQWSWFAEATFAQPLGEIFNHLRACANEPKEDVLEEMRTRARLWTAALDAALEGRSYLVGEEFTGADIMTGYSLLLAGQIVPFQDLEHLRDYGRRISTRPAYLAAIA